MTEQFSTSKLRFYLTEPQPCPYLPNRVEQKVFAPLGGPHAAELHDELSVNGFRRSQNVAYRPRCPGCSACVATRVKAMGFEPARRERRILRRNAHLRRQVKPPVATDSQYTLFRTYIRDRHAEGGMAAMDEFDFISMVEDSTVRTQVIEYWGETREGADALRAVSLTDVMIDGLSMVYSFFDPDHARDSLGRFMVLDHLEMVRTLGLEHLYLGYWIDGCQKMAYKADFAPCEFLVCGRWVSAGNRRNG